MLRRLWIGLLERIERRLDDGDDEAAFYRSEVEFYTTGKRPSLPRRSDRVRRR